ncbi:MAG: trypsin-like peptidase domain-containing protein [Aphanizomenon flos-aquae Clear-A1]|jgi:S1-C subfamily serine protease|uniref:Peptidase S1 n=1 Tax=Aphanizomenon flos-aquae WA102 TaxID=1710896 RepID=A0A1B7X6V5_APHFL|nr:trypsin-like peptidase domain-containing protein [Aphanizomenon flos-aquae Clear-A1]OBQ22576.1 MAG: peptidase S1 [Anabaena sp. WA113]OBQ45074.1 MAG: peptidase S1 [Aphanizomenon flos-aquae WA102]QSV65961.1 MAG: trypsin-like peptidase domain-containing protein [Aphanizomenon flos-aquae DEX188]
MFSPIARRLFLIFITTFSVIQLYAYSHPVVLGATSSENFDITAAKIANQVTVRILTKFGSGSGVVIKHEGQTYTVLTNNHVVTDSPEDGYGILTSDGNIYPAKQVNGVNTKKLDLALVKFTSPEDYQVVTLPKSKAISEGEKVYASGFPAWHFIFKGKKITKMEETRNWGVKAFKIKTGTIKMQLTKTLPGGYQLGNTNDIFQGMSGGPALNQQGELIGINGLLKYPFQGIDAFTFTDGTIPKEEDYLQMESLSWAIPIDNILAFLEEQKIVKENKT